MKKKLKHLNSTVNIHNISTTHNKIIDSERFKNFAILRNVIKISLPNFENSKLMI